VELAWLAALGYLEPGDRALVVGPTFGEYERAARIAGAQIIPFRARPEHGFALDIPQIDGLLNLPSPNPIKRRKTTSALPWREVSEGDSPRRGVRRRPELAEGGREITAHSVKAVFICNPNNPTGVLVPPDTIWELASHHSDALFVVDEAYVPFVDAGASCLNGGLRDNLLVLRSMTKDCAIPGLRLGYALAVPEIIRVLCTVQPTWSVGAPAQAAGLAALGCAGGFQAEGLELLTESKRYLMTALAELGLEVLPSAANFFLARVGDGAAFRRALLLEGCCVRDCASFGLPEFVRIGVRTMPECQRLVAAIAKVLEQKRLRSARMGYEGTEVLNG